MLWHSMEDDLKILEDEHIPKVGSSSILKLKLMGPNQNQKCLKYKQPQMEDNLKILEDEHISNH
jgi:hypothetical protein